ncbi:MAG TPA: YdcF family protein [Rhizomicrobium sp.]
MFWRSAVALLAVYLIGFAVFVAELPASAPRAVSADAVVALTGSEDRLDAAVALFEHGVGHRLLITGVHPFMTKALLKPLLHGGPRFDCCADLGFAATNTHGNAMEAAGWARAHGYRSLVVVTANYHMPRSLEEFSAAMPGVRLVPYPVPEIVARRRWWFNPGAIRTLQYEYAKFLGSLALRTVYPHHWAQTGAAVPASTS